MARRARRPTISPSRRAGIPVPGFFAAIIVVSITVPSGMATTVTTLFSKISFIGLQPPGGTVLVDPTREGRLDGSHTAHQICELGGLERVSRVAAVHEPREGEVLFNHSGSERHRGKRRVVAQRVVRQADVEAVALGHLEHDVEADLLRRARVLRGALQDGDPLVVAADRRHRLVELGPGAHPRRQQDRLSGLRESLEHREVRDLPRADLVALDPDSLEQLDRLDRERRRQELHPVRLAVRLQLLPLLERKARPLEVLEPRLPLEVRRRRRVPQRLGGGEMGLELHHVGASRRRGLDELARVAEAAVVDGADLGDDLDLQQTEPPLRQTAVSRSRSPRVSCALNENVPWWCRRAAYRIDTRTRRSAIYVFRIAISCRGASRPCPQRLGRSRVRTKKSEPTSVQLPTTSRSLSGSARNTITIRTGARPALIELATALSREQIPERLLEQTATL